MSSLKVPDFWHWIAPGTYSIDPIPIPRAAKAEIDKEISAIAKPIWRRFDRLQAKKKGRK